MFFHAPASFVCRLRKSIVWADTLGKRRAWSCCLLVLLQRSGPERIWMNLCHWKQPAHNQETIPPENFEDQQQLKMLHYINYAFMLLSSFFFFPLGDQNRGAVRFNIQQVWVWESLQWRNYTCKLCFKCFSWKFSEKENYFAGCEFQVIILWYSPNKIKLQ